MDVRTASLDGKLDDKIFLVIPEGLNIDKQTKFSRVCKLQKTIYGLRISPKKWNEKYTQVALE